MRRIAVLGGLVAALVLVPVAPASAAAVPISGSITCGITGKVSFGTPLRNASLDPNRGRTAVRIQATMTDCDVSQVQGGRAAITGGTVSVSGLLDAESGCADLDGPWPPDFTFEPNHFAAKWTGVRSGGARLTVGQSRALVTWADAMGPSTADGWQYDTEPININDAFGDNYATLRLMLDDPALVDACASGATGANGKPVNLSSVSFSAAKGSQLVVAP